MNGNVMNFATEKLRYRKWKQSVSMFYQNLIQKCMCNTVSWKTLTYHCSYFESKFSSNINILTFNELSKFCSIHVRKRSAIDFCFLELTDVFIAIGYFCELRTLRSIANTSFRTLSLFLTNILELFETQCILEFDHTHKSCQQKIW